MQETQRIPSGAESANRPDYYYDAFASYSRAADYQLVRRIESFLESFHTLEVPKEITLHQIQLCVDGSAFSLTELRAQAQQSAKNESISEDEELKRLIAERLSHCRYLLVICAGETAPTSASAIDIATAAESRKWRDWELEYFLRTRGADAVLLAVTHGRAPWERPEDFFLPRIIQQSLHQKLWYDLRGFYEEEAKDWLKVSDFEDERLRLAADLNGQKAEKIAPLWYRERERAALEQARRDRLRLWFAVGSAVLIAVAGVVATYQWLETRKARDAEKRQSIALQGALRRGGANAYNTGNIYWRDGKWSEAVRSFLEAVELDPNHEFATISLWRAIATARGNVAVPDVVAAIDPRQLLAEKPGAEEYFRLHPNRNLAVIVKRHNRTAELWDTTENWKLIQELPLPNVPPFVNPPMLASWSPDGELLTVLVADGYFFIFRRNDNKFEPVTIPVKWKESGNSPILGRHGHVFVKDQDTLSEWDLLKDAIVSDPVPIPRGVNVIAVGGDSQWVLITPTPEAQKSDLRGGSKLFQLRRRDIFHSLGAKFDSAQFSKDGEFVIGTIGTADDDFSKGMLVGISIEEDREIVIRQANVSRYMLSPSGRYVLAYRSNGWVLMRCEDGEVVWANPGNLSVDGFHPQRDEIELRHTGKRAYYKLPPGEPALSEAELTPERPWVELTQDRSYMAIQRLNHKKVIFVWPSLEKRDRLPFRSNRPEELQHFPINRPYLASNMVYGMSFHPLAPIPNSPHLVSGGNSDWTLYYLSSMFSRFGGESLVAVPTRAVRPPGAIRRFIEPFLDWGKEWDGLEQLVALREQLRLELLDRFKNSTLPDEWRDLLAWWTTKPSERKSLK